MATSRYMAPRRYGHIISGTAGTGGRPCLTSLKGKRVKTNPLTRTLPRRDFLGLSVAGAAGVCLTGMGGRSDAAEATISAPALPDPPPQGSLRVCFFTDAHLPG